MSNIYLNEFDRFMKHKVKPLAYMRYGDDWLCFMENKADIDRIRVQGEKFLHDELALTVNPKIDSVQPTYKGIDYLGVEIWPSGRRLQLSVRERVISRLDQRNVASYRALIAANEKHDKLKALHWQLIEQDIAKY
jgi:hypothetical protein